MSEAISKKYIKALVSTLDSQELEGVNDVLASLASAFENAKFKNIIFSNDVKKSEKENFILSLIEKPSGKLVNFIKLLTENGRLGELPAMSQELKKQIAIQNNSYNGVLVSNFDVDSKEIASLEKNLSTKLGSTISLENRVTDYPGLKVEIDDLGVEVGLSTDRVKAQLAEHILKAI